MSTRQPQLSLPIVPTLRQCMLSIIKKSTHCVLSLNPKTLTLTTFYWCVMILQIRLVLDSIFDYPRRPVHGTERVTPDALRTYRKCHVFLGPCCLCPLLQPHRGKPRYAEAAIYLPVQGRYKGEYIAECAENKCGYLGGSSLRMLGPLFYRLPGASSSGETVSEAWTPSEKISPKR